MLLILFTAGSLFLETLPPILTVAKSVSILLGKPKFVKKSSTSLATKFPPSIKVFLTLFFKLLFNSSVFKFTLLSLAKFVITS